MVCHAELIPIDYFLCNQPNRGVYKCRGCWLSVGKHRYTLEKAEPLEAHQHHPVPSTFPKHRPEVGGRKLKLHCQENPIPTVHKAVPFTFWGPWTPGMRSFQLGTACISWNSHRTALCKHSMCWTLGNVVLTRQLQQTWSTGTWEKAPFCCCHCYPLPHIQTVALKNKRLSLEVFQKGGTRRTE